MKDCALEYSDKGDMRILQRHLHIGIISTRSRGASSSERKNRQDNGAVARADAAGGVHAKDDVEAPGKVRASVPLRRRGATFLGSVQSIHWGTRVCARVGHCQANSGQPAPYHGNLVQLASGAVREGGRDVAPRSAHGLVQLGARNRHAGAAAPGWVLGQWDSSPEGAAGISIRERPGEVWKTGGMRYEGATSIATFRAPLEAQFHRESAGGPLAMRLLRSLVEIRGRRILFVNDYLPVVLAMQKGSNSRVLQADAEYMAIAGLEAGASLMFLHVPSTHMIEEGVDYHRPFRGKLQQAR